MLGVRTSIWQLAPIAGRIAAHSKTVPIRGTLIAAGKVSEHSVVNRMLGCHGNVTVIEANRGELRIKGE